MAKKTPSSDSLLAAAEWLDMYEGHEDDEERDAMHAVAEWLRYKAEISEVRSMCRGLGVSVKKFRIAMRATEP